jgi:predicted O-methyltransferase YrrM
MADEKRWTEVDEYFSKMLVKSDSALDDALAASARAGLPAIAVTANQGKLLLLMARMIGAQRILEIGTLGGYSTIWLARAVAPVGRVITLEAEPSHARIAEANINRAGMSNVVEIVVGKALETLPKIASAGDGPFDLIFIDADKENLPAYFEWAMKLVHAGSVIVIDNVVRKGAIVDAASKDASVQGTRRMMEMIAAETRVSATAIQTVGGKGYDGLAIVRVNAV